MKIITRLEQEEIFQALVYLTVILAPVEGAGVIDGLNAIEQIATIVGGSQMVKDLGGRND